MNVRLTAAQRAQAANLADDETVTLTELGKRSMTPDTAGNIAALAVWMRQETKRLEGGTPTFGYTGRNHR